MLQQVGVLPKSVWIRLKTEDTPRKIGNAKLVGMIRIIIVLQCCPRFFHVV